MSYAGQAVIIPTVVVPTVCIE